MSIKKIDFKTIECEYIDKKIRLRGRLGEVEIDISPYYIENGKNWIKVKNIPNYLKTRIIQMDKGLTIGYTRELTLTGVWNKVIQNGKELTFNIGYSHPIKYILPNNLALKTYKEGSDRYFVLFSIDNELVSQVAAHLYHLKKPEPYKGTGFNYLSKRIKKKSKKGS